MRKIYYFVILLCLLEVKCKASEDEFSQLNIDVKKIKTQKWKVPIRRKKNFQINENDEEAAEILKLHWRGNGEFGRKFTNNFLTESSIWNEDDDESSIDVPSRLIQPPFEFYSTSIQNSPIEAEEKFPTAVTTTTIIPDTTTTVIPPDFPSISSENEIKNKILGRSFMIEDPSAELKSSDSLRSVILNRQQILENQLTDENKGNVIRSNGLQMKNYRTATKSFYPTRGNRKYQKSLDNDDETPAVSDTTWSYPTRKIRPLNRVNNYRSFGSISRVYNLRTGERVDMNFRTGSVRDYPIEQEPTNRLQKVTGRFLCPYNSNSHIYLADRASGCQVFYVCFGSETGVPMRCPSGTLFSEELQVCDWWFNVTC